MDIRPARREDVPELLDIYNYEVINGAATLDLNTRTLEEWYEWYDAHNKDNHPLTEKREWDARSWLIFSKWRRMTRGRTVWYR